MTDETTGRLAEELRLLIDVVAERAQPWLQKMAEAGEPDAHDARTCGWCPLCNSVALLRGDRSELAAQAAEHVAGLLAVVRAALREPVVPQDDPPPPPESRVQHIKVVRRSGPC